MSLQIDSGGCDQVPTGLDGLGGCGRCAISKDQEDQEGKMESTYRFAKLRATVTVNFYPISCCRKPSMSSPPLHLSLSQSRKLARSTPDREQYVSSSASTSSQACLHCSSASLRAERSTSESRSPISEIFCKTKVKPSSSVSSSRTWRGREPKVWIVWKSFLPDLKGKSDRASTPDANPIGSAIISEAN